MQSEETAGAALSDTSEEEEAVSDVLDHEGIHEVEVVKVSDPKVAATRHLCLVKGDF